MQLADRDLLQRFRSGDDGAFEAFYNRHKDRLYRHALVQTGGRPAIAEEVVQDVFLSMYAKSVEPERSVAGYMLTSVRNRALNAIQRRESRASHLGEGAAQLVAGGDAPEGAAHKQEEAQLLAEALLDLTPEQREVVLLRTFEALPWREVAELVGVPLPTASARYRAALARLRTRCRSLLHA